MVFPRSSTSGFSPDCVRSAMTLVSDNTGHRSQQTTNDGDFIVADGGSLVPERFQQPSLSPDDPTLVGLGRGVSFDPTVHQHHHSTAQWFTGSRGSGQDFLYDRLSVVGPDPSGLQQDSDSCGAIDALHGGYPGIGTATGCGWYGSGDVPTPAGTSCHVTYGTALDAARIFPPSTQLPRQSCQLLSSSSSSASASSANFRAPYYHPIGNGYAYVTDDGAAAKF